MHYVIRYPYNLQDKKKNSSLIGVSTSRAFFIVKIVQVNDGKDHNQGKWLKE